jgi:hypothetical protein
LTRGREDSKCQIFFKKKKLPLTISGKVSQEFLNFLVGEDSLRALQETTLGESQREAAAVDRYKPYPSETGTTCWHFARKGTSKKGNFKERELQRNFDRKEKK